MSPKLEGATRSNKKETEYLFLDHHYSFLFTALIIMLVHNDSEYSSSEKSRNASKSEYQFYENVSVPMLIQAGQQERSIHIAKQQLVNFSGGRHC